MKQVIPTHDPQTGELNPYYEELTGEKNPLEIQDKTVKLTKLEKIIGKIKKSL
tara:strand:+ start:4709 stop:4867 length:159 start_codon:yes stop_codon:yes gene_type:complete